MEIFHYVSDQLKGVPLFESEIMEEFRGSKPMIGAVCNDYDSQSPFQNMVTPSLEPSLTENSSSTSIIDEADIDYALLEADEYENIFDKHTCNFQTENFDNTTSAPDSAYYSKVIIIL